MTSERYVPLIKKARETLGLDSWIETWFAKRPLLPDYCVSKERV